MTQSGHRLITNRPPDFDFRMTEEKKISIEYPVGTDDAAYVTFVGPNKARLELDPMSCMFTDDETELKSLPEYRDLIELDEIEPGKHRFVRVLERARFQRFQFMLSDPEAQAKVLNPILSRTMELGGNWERAFGGILTIFLPNDCSYDPTEDIRTTLTASSRE